MLVGGQCDDRVGYFVRPTIVLTDDPTNEEGWGYERKVYGHVTEPYK